MSIDPDAFIYNLLRYHFGCIILLQFSAFSKPPEALARSMRVLAPSSCSNSEFWRVPNSFHLIFGYLDWSLTSSLKLIHLHKVIWGLLKLWMSCCLVGQGRSWDPTVFLNPSIVINPLGPRSIIKSLISLSYSKASIKFMNRQNQFTVVWQMREYIMY